MSSQVLSQFAEDIYRAKRYDWDGTEDWPDTARRVSTHVLGALGYGPQSDEVHAAFAAIRDRKFMPGGRYLYSSGRPLHQTQNCMLLRAEDTREGWSDTYWKANTALMTGAGIGIEYSDLREENAYLKRTGGVSSGPIPHMKGVDSLGRAAVQGGSRRAAIWAGLSWQHPDVLKFIRIKDWDADLRRLKEQKQDLPMEMEFTNVSVILDDDFFRAYEAGDEMAHTVYWRTVDRMLRTGEPGFSIDVGDNAGETLRNACTEITSADDSDVCNLGSINMARIESEGEFGHVVDIATLFLLAGTVYSDVPYPGVEKVRAKNRRLGLGLMGLHEWLLRRGKQYGPDSELGDWLRVYARESVASARFHAERHSLSTPIKTRAIAPNGTIAMVAETTHGMEPVYCAAYARRYLENGLWVTKYVVDPTVERLQRDGIVEPDMVEDAYALAATPERRLEFQAWLQQYVDHGISSTVNLPHPIHEKADQRELGEKLLSFLPRLRGVTFYPNGARSGQPLEPVEFGFAQAMHAATEDSDETCVSGVCAV